MRFANKKRTFISIAPLALAATVALVSSGCGNGGGGGEGAGGSEETTLQRIQEAGTVRIGFANEEPYGYVDTATGEVTGEAPEIAKRILADLGVEQIEPVVTEFGSLIPGLKAGRFDVVAAGMYIKPERCEQVDFSNPTYSIGEGIAVRTGNPMGLHSYEDIRDKGATFAVVTGAIELEYARAVGIPDDNIVRYGDAPSAVAAVAAGRADAYGGTALTVQDLVDKDRTGNVERADPFTNPVIEGESVRGYGAFAFRPEDDDLREAFNQRLAAFIGTEEHAELVRPFGFTEAELPGGMTADELCAAQAQAN